MCFLDYLETFKTWKCNLKLTVLLFTFVGVLCYYIDNNILDADLSDVEYNLMDLLIALNFVYCFINLGIILQVYIKKQANHLYEISYLVFGFAFFIFFGLTGIIISVKNKLPGTAIALSVLGLISGVIALADFIRELREGGLKQSDENKIMPESPEMTKYDFIVKLIILLLVLPVMICYYVESGFDEADLGNFEYMIMKIVYWTSLLQVIEMVIMLLMHLFKESHYFHEFQCLSNFYVCIGFGIAGTVISVNNNVGTCAVPAAACLITAGLIMLFYLCKTMSGNSREDG